MLDVHILEQEVQSAHTFVREGGCVEGRLLAVYELDEEELAEVVIILEDGGTRQTWAKKRYALMAVNGDAPARVLAVGATRGCHQCKYVYNRSKVQRVIIIQFFFENTIWIYVLKSPTTLSTR